MTSLSLFRRTTRTPRPECWVRYLTDEAYVSANYDHTCKIKLFGLFLMLSPFLVTVCMKKLNLVFHIPPFLRLHPELMSTSEDDQIALTDCSSSENAIFFSVSRN
jgi:hypothetical protein